MIIYYWSPCLTKVGTYKSTIHSMISLAKYSSKRNKIKIINSCGEWNEQKDFFKRSNIEVVDFGFNYFRYLPKTGFIGSRFSYLIIFFTSLIPLIKIILKEKPDYLILHLITSLPLLINSIFKNKTKIVLRISGYPRLNFLRYFFWKFSNRFIYKITCPSVDLKKQLIKINLFDENKIFFLADPIISIEDQKKNYLKTQNKNNIKIRGKYFIAVGRLTKQKNFNYLINEFKDFVNHNKDYELLIFGEGEDKIKLLNSIQKYKLDNHVRLMGYSNYIFDYMRQAEAFILSSLWEDPGFVLIEAAMCNLFIISSDCKNGPREILLNGKGGLLYETNKKGELNQKLNLFLNLDKKKYDMKLLTKKNILKYTLFRHYKSFRKNIILDMV